MRETHGIPSNKREAAKSAAQTGKKRGRPRKGQAIAPGVAAAVAELGAKGTALRLLRQLKEIRSKLDQRIGAVEELVEVL
jgi:1-aminocyclopropane-1-carboxylate deaminase/D-cysteine desulfhydrase-like pyridoxal-dependent ACC family enzyme